MGWEDPPGEGNGSPLQYSGLENTMKWIVHRVAKSRTRLSDFHFHFHPTLQKLSCLFVHRCGCCCLVAKSCLTLQPCGLQPTRLLCLCDFPDKNTGVGCHFLVQGPSQPRDQTWISCIAGECFTTEPPEKPYLFTGVLVTNFPYKDASSAGQEHCFVPLLHPPALHGARHIVGAPEIVGE